MALQRMDDIGIVVESLDAAISSFAQLGLEVERRAMIEGASSGLLSEKDYAEAAQVLVPGTTAALLIYENTWAAPFATALRKAGAQLVANGRLPVNAIIAALDEVEQRDGATA